jgi:hypothetical protein
LAVVIGAILLIVTSAGIAFAGTITTPTGNPFVWPGDAAGNPVSVTIVATGYTSGTLVSVEQCDGVAPTVPNWSPTTHCDLATSPAQVIVDSTGKATFPANDPNHGFTPFKGESPQSLFNCLSPNGPALNPVNGLTDYRNCKIRVSTSNNSVTADQAFLNIQLPEATSGTTTTTTTTSTTTSTSTTSTSTSTTTTVPGSTTTTTVPTGGTSAGSCSGAKLLVGKAVGTDPANLGLTDQTHRVTMGASLMTDLATKTKIAGTCSGLVVPSDYIGGAIPSTLHPKSIALKLSGFASCASSASARTADATKSGAFMLSGNLSITMNELDAQLVPKPFKVLAYVAAKYDPASTDVLTFTGIVKTGASLGATVSGKLYLDPVSKITPALKPPSGTGYQFDSAGLGHCTDGTANNASIVQAQLGNGSSLAGTTSVSGLAFGY